MQLFQARARNLLLRAKEKKLKADKKKCPIWDWERHTQLANAIRMIGFSKLCSRYRKPEPEIDVFDMI